MVKWGVLGTANIAKNCTIPGMQKWSCSSALIKRDL